MIRISLPAAAALAAAASWLAAQEPAEQPVFTSGAEVVIVDVVVTDDSWPPARGLGREDFVVHEDGAGAGPHLLRIHRPAGRGDARADPRRPRRGGEQRPHRSERATVVVIFDELHLSPLATEMAGQRLRESWGRGSLGPAEVLLVDRRGRGLAGPPAGGRGRAAGGPRAFQGARPPRSPRA